MTEDPAPTVCEQNRTSLSELKVTVERLEFGKFCVSPEGPIESDRDNIPIGYSQLGRSSGFPEELIASCHPTNLGIAKEGADVVPLEATPGSVLRPIVNADRVRVVFYRVRSRPEDGEGKSGRRYTVATYLSAPADQVNPLTMLAAMNSLPLAGITRAAARDISPIHREPEEPELDHAAEAFLRGALIYILSGVAISITEHISEEQFFSWVSAAYTRLPPLLRPHLSAGWNVGSSYSGKLGITYTTHHAASTAVFSPTTHTWSPPKYVTTWNAEHQPVVNGFFNERLEPGRLFERYVSWASTSESSTRMEERISKLVDSLPPVELPELPDWDNPLTVRIFRYPGLQVRDQFILTTLAKWLARGEDSAQLCLDAKQLSYHSNRIKALNLILDALAEPSSRSRADQALWVSITGKVPASFTNLLKGAAGVAARRAQLIAAISSGDVFNTLAALQAVPLEECADLPDEAAGRLVEILDQSIQDPSDTTLSYHSRLLLSPPPQYQEWIVRRSLPLMRALGSQEEPSKEALKAILNFNGSETIKALHCFLTDETEILPPAIADVIKRLRPEERSVFIDIFKQRWEREDERTALRREALLGHFRVLQPPNSTHPLLRLLSGVELTDADVSRIADDVESKHVPQSLSRQVAELALRRWSLLGRRIIARHINWLPVTDLWPRKYARVLGRGHGTDSPHPQIAHAAEQLQLNSENLKVLLQLWFLEETFNEAAPLLWDWALQLQPRSGVPLTAFDLCKHFVEGRLPDVDLTEYEFENFVKLARLSGRANLPSKAVQEMWQVASRYWHIRFLLTVFPQENLIPDPAQLSILMRHRDWLQEHFRDPQVHFARGNAFRVATEPFHSLSFRESPEWRDGFTKYPIWGAFRGVPVSTLRPRALRTALRAYTGSDYELRTGAQSENLIEEQARMCLTFLEAYQGTASENGAIRTVLVEFVLPLLSYRWNKEGIQGAIAFVGSELKLPGYERDERDSNLFGPFVYELVSKILLLTDYRFVNDIVKEFNKKPR